MIDLTKEQKLIILGLIAIIVIGCLVIVFNKYSITDETEEPVMLSESSVVQVESENDGNIIVHVNGAVKREGVYKLKEGDRIYDLILLAGGLLEGADFDSINFASTLSDAQKINIPIIKEKHVTVSRASGISRGSSSIINLNSASKSELVSLPGIGTSTAQKIIDLRNKKGRFGSVDDLKEIKGISDKKIKKFSSLVTVN